MQLQSWCQAFVYLIYLLFISSLGSNLAGQLIQKYWYAFISFPWERWSSCKCFL